MTASSYLVGALTCSRCRRLNPADTSTSITNGISLKPGGEVLRVGEVADFDIDDFEAAFLILRLPQPQEAIHLLHEWWCLFCGNFNWAEAVFSDRVFRRFSTVLFEAKTIARAHFITDAIREFYAERTGREPPAPYEGWHLDLIRELVGDWTSHASS